MRVLILSAFLAYAAAAPSGSIAPLIYPAVAIPGAIPTISPGDIQAAAIDAQVKYNDLARSAVDKAQEITDLSVSNINEKVITDVNLANERIVEAFWSNEDKKWQAIDALKTAEAQIDGTAANNAAVLAKSTIGGVIPYVAAASPVGPVVAAAIPPPIPPVVYTPYGAAAKYTPYGAAAKSVSTQTIDTKTEEKESKVENQETVVKNAESEKSEAIVETSDNAISESATEKSAENPGNVLVTALSGYNLAVPTARLVGQPVINYAAIQPVHGFLAPTFVKAF